MACVKVARVHLQFCWVQGQNVQITQPIMIHESWSSVPTTEKCLKLCPSQVPEVDALRLRLGHGQLLAPPRHLRQQRRRPRHHRVGAGLAVADAALAATAGRAGHRHASASVVLNCCLGGLK